MRAGISISFCYFKAQKREKISTREYLTIEREIVWTMMV